MRRLGRYSLRLLAIPIVLALSAGAIAAVLLFSRPGRALTSRVASSALTSAFAGHVQIGLIGGNLFDHLSITDVRITDSLGNLLVSAPRMDLRYRLADLLDRRIVFSAVTIDSAVIHMVQKEGGGWNYETIFRVSHGPSGGTPPLVVLHGLVLREASFRLDVPTKPRMPRIPVSRHAAQPDQPRVEQGANGLVRVRTFEHLNANITTLRLSTPDHLPLFADIAMMRAEINDPKLQLTDFKGTLLSASDTLRFTLDHADLSNTHVRGAGAVRWPHDSLKFDFALDADRVDLADLKWVSPDFPDWHGAGHLVAFSPSGSRTEYRLDRLTLGNGISSAKGKLVAIVDNAHGLGMRDLDLALTAAPLDLMRPYLDTLPFAGALTGHLTADGFLDAMHLGGDLNFTDALVSGAPVSHIVMDGTVHFGGKEGAVFENFHLQHSEFALATVHRVAPSIVLPGTMDLDGHLNGPWQNADFVGTVEHHAPDGSISRLLGAVRLDTRDTVLGLALDADFDQLSFDALRSGYPSITARGGLVGHVMAKGTLASLELHATMTGDVGTFAANGRIAAMSPRFSADSLDLDLERFDLEALMGEGQSSSLNGHLLVTGTIDSLVPPKGRVELALDRSRVGGVTFSSAYAHLSAADGIVTFDTAAVVWPDGGLSARGSLGWSAPDSGTLAVEAYATALGSLDSLARAALGIARDTLHPRPFNGLARASFVVKGSRDVMRVTGSVDADSVVLDNWSMHKVHANITADSLGARGLTVDALIDSLRHGDQLVDSIHVAASGRKDSLHIDGGGRMGALTASGSGSVRNQPNSTTIGLERLALDFPKQQWRLARPASFTVTDQSTVLADTLQLQTKDGSGLISLVGTIPGAGTGDLDASVVGLNMSDVYAMLQQDTTVLGGLASLDFHLGGSREAPTVRGNASITGAVSGAVRAPLVHAAFDYQSRRLRSNVTFWSTGDPILDVDVSLPIDLALAKREERRLPGPISITAKADSIDLLVLEALLPGVENTRGSMRLNFAASGTWDAPKLLGDLTLQNAEMTVPSLRVRYDSISGSARFTGDSLLVDTMRLHSGGGDLTINGDIRFKNLANAYLNLNLSAHEFLAMDSPTLVRLRPTGNVTLTGPLLQPVMRSVNGEPILLTGSVLYFADLITKNALDLDDPLLRDLVDTVAIRKQGLRPDFQNRFLDSLRIENTTFELGSDVWLRSSEANIQLEGQVDVSKTRKLYRLVGALNAPRGTYTLRIGGIFPRLFTVESGSVVYQGDPDKADLNLSASHNVRTSEGEDVLIVARITGSIQVPKLDLQSPGRNLTFNEKISYLAVGRPDLQLGKGQVGNQFGSEGLSLISAEIQRSILALGVQLDVLEFNPGVASSTGGSALWQFAAGKQLSSKWFVMVNAGICLGAGNSSLSQRNFGASLEYRMTHEFRLQASAEPVQSCSLNRTNDVFSTLTRYQLGGDLLWSRDY